jgi:FKBP-type peptidyl-prolyl cis-trans isomerase
MFRVDRGLVIDGWDQILQLMRPGDKWIVIIPPELAYGRRGSPPKVPPYATLVFEMEILGIKKDS